MWQVGHEMAAMLLYALYFMGWTLMITASALINHWDLFGMRQVRYYLQDRPYVALDFVKPGLYRRIRHPLYLGFLIAFWATPTMTGTHLFFSILMSGYIAFGIALEERDLIADFGRRYLLYRRRTPALLPVSPPALRAFWREIKERFTA